MTKGEMRERKGLDCPHGSSNYQVAAWVKGKREEKGERGRGKKRERGGGRRKGREGEGEEKGERGREKKRERGGGRRQT